MLAVLLTSCRPGGKVPAKGTEAYESAVSSFYVGLAALQVGNDVLAEEKSALFTTQASGEPVGWANWGVLALRQRNYEVASQRIEHARQLASQNDHIYFLLGLLESERGHSAEAMANLRKAVDLNPQNLRAAYQLAQEIERQGGAESDAEFQQVIQKILAAQPNNLAALLELGRIAAKRFDGNTLKSAVAQIGAHSSTWPPEVQQQLATLQTAVASSDWHAAATRTVFLRNALMRVPEYRQNLAAIKSPPGEEAQPFTHFLKMETPSFSPAPADSALAFDAQPVAAGDSSHWNWIGAIPLGSSGAPIVAAADAHKVHLMTGATIPFPGGASNTPPSPEGILPVDFNYDFKTDLVLAGAGGVRLFRQDSPTAFTDVSAATKLPKDVVNAKYLGAWAVDIEADGDLDIVLGVAEGLPTVLQNNGDDTFTAIHPFTGISGLRGFAWVDLDGDGNPDAAIIDGAGHLHVFINERQGQFAERALPANLSPVKAIAVADANNDGILDLIAVQSDGAIVRISDKNEGQSWEVAEIARVSNPGYLNEEVRLHVADLDNNGALDLILRRLLRLAGSNGALIWLRGQNGVFTLLDHPVGPATVFDIADLNSDGRLDLARPLCRRPGDAGIWSRIEELSLAGRTTACGTGLRRSAHQPIWHWWRD